MLYVASLSVFLVLRKILGGENFNCGFVVIVLAFRRLKSFPSFS